MRKGLWAMLGLHLVRAAILARVARFGKGVVPFFGFGTGGGRFWSGAQAVEGFLENRR